MLVVGDKPLGQRGVGWHTVVCYGGPEWVRENSVDEIEFGVCRSLNVIRRLVSSGSIQIWNTHGSETSSRPFIRSLFLPLFIQLAFC